MTDKRIKRYELLEEVGRGGMAVVYRGRDTALEREVAVKVLHPHLASRPESARRFHREARAVARLRHRNIVEIFDTSSEEDGPGQQQFIVTEFVDGGTLRDFVEKHRVEFPCIGVAIALELCEALRHAHALGIIHRDIKPENVMLGRAGNLKLMDFGIAQVLDADRMTASGSLLGSPAHMPPEIIDGKAADFRADIFSLGTVLYYVCCNALPFEGNSPTAVLRNIIESRFEDPSRRNPRIGRRLAAIIRRCLATRPEDRFATVAELEEALHKELASVGIDDPATLARDYLADPAGTAERFYPVIIERLLARAEEAVAEREVASATDWLNRVLAYDADNARALALLDRLGSRRRVRLIAALVGASVLLGALGWLFVTLASGERHPLAAAQVAIDASVPVTTPPPGPDDGPPPVTAPSLSLDGVRAAVQRQLHDATSDAIVAFAPRRARYVLVAELGGAALIGGNLGAVSHDTPVVASIVPRRIETGPRRTTQGTRPTTEPGSADERAASEGTSAEAETQPAAPVKASVVIPVFPSTAVVYSRTRPGKGIGADDDGNIRLSLEAGTHEIVIADNRCNEKTIRVTVSEEDVRSGRTVSVPLVKLTWRDGLVAVTSKKDKVAFLYAIDGAKVARWLPAEEQTFKVLGFSQLGKKRTVTVWQVPNDGTLLPSEKVSDLGKFPRKDFEVGPGEVKRIIFD